MSQSVVDRIEKQILVQAPPQRVWETLTDAPVFGRLFSFEMSGSFAPGARLQGKVTHPDYRGVTFDLTVERMEAPRLLSWRWHPGPPDPGSDYSEEPTTLVVVELQRHPDGTLVKLVESGFDGIPLARRATALKTNEEGWGQVLESLRQRVEATA